MKRFFVLAGVFLGIVVNVSAQTEKDLKQYFEGRQVRVRIDIPNTKDGVNIYPERERSFDQAEYAARVREHGTAAHHDEMVVVSRIKVKDRHIEVQMKSMAAGVVSSRSRFNIHFERIDPLILSPQVLVGALKPYVEFSPADLALLKDVNQPYAIADSRKSRVVRVGESTTYLENGLSMNEVVSLLGKPTSVSTRNENGVSVTTCEFKRNEEKTVVAEFVANALVKSRTEMRAREARVEGY